MDLVRGRVAEVLAGTMGGAFVEAVSGVEGLDVAEHWLAEGGCFT